MVRVHVWNTYELEYVKLHVNGIDDMIGLCGMNNVLIVMKHINQFMSPMSHQRVVGQTWSTKTTWSNVFTNKHLISGGYKEHMDKRICKTNIDRMMCIGLL